MTLYSYLYDNYGFSKPIILSELKESSNVKSKNLKQLLYSLEKEEKITRYSSGVYYIPKDTILGKSKLSFESVIERKYILNDNEVFGFYDGLTLLNLFDLTSQVPFVLEILSNKTTSKKREIKINSRKAIIRRSKIKITKENYRILRFFRLFRFLNYEEVIENKSKLKKYIKTEKISRLDFEKYSIFMTKKEMEIIIRSGLIYEFTSK